VHTAEVLLDVPASFASLLAPLSVQLADLDRRTVYLMFPPLPQDSLVGDRTKAARAITKILGIPDSNFLPTPAERALEYFATDTHLNEHGRAEFTAELAQVIRSRIPLSALSAVRNR
jgi:hypothetical protein